MQILFLWDTQQQSDPASAQQFAEEHLDDADARHLALTSAAGAWEQRAATDAWVERIAPQWPTRRQPAVDRSLLRMAVWELTSTATPPKVVIDEAIELAKEYSTEQSAAFINAVLDSIHKEQQRLTGA